VVHPTGLSFLLQTVSAGMHANARKKRGTLGILTGGAWVSFFLKRDALRKTGVDVYFQTNEQDRMLLAVSFLVQF